METHRFLVATAMTLLVSATVSAQVPAANYDESKVPSYELPDPLVTPGGTTVTSAQQWQEQGRPETLRLFEREMYGRSPGRPVQQHWVVWDESDEALGGLARRKQVAR